MRNDVVLSGIDHPGDVDLLAGESLARAWAQRFRSHPQRPAALDALNGQRMTYGELGHCSENVAARLFEAGLRAGDRIIFSAASSLDFLTTYVAAVRLGLVVVPMDAKLTDREARHVINDAAPRAAIVDEVERITGLKEIELIMTPAVDLPDGPVPPLDESRRDDLAMIAYTSGTTGQPKGAMLSSGNLLASAEALVLAWQWASDDCLVLALPLFHMHGLGVGLNGTLTAGASLVLLNKFDVDAVFDASSTYHASLFFGVPTMYQRLAASPRVTELASLRLCVSGSAPLPLVLHQTIARIGHQQILERYGMTETVMIASNPYDQERRAGTVGQPLPGVQVRIGEGGEILVKGPNVFHGYWHRPDATADSFTVDGWFRSGDLGSVDHGYLSIVGRIKDLIITGGHNVYPREVEEVLLTHPHVVEVAVAGIASDEWGETVGAWIVGDPDLDIDDIQDFVATRLVRYKRPRTYYRVSALPRNAMGKVVKRELTTTPGSYTDHTSAGH